MYNHKEHFKHTLPQFFMGCTVYKQLEYLLVQKGETKVSQLRSNPCKSLDLSDIY